MDIVFSANNRQELVVLPFVSPDTTVDEPQNNDTFTGLSRDVNLIGPRGLRQLKISSILPKGRYPFLSGAASPSPRTYLDFFRRWRDEKVPLRVVWTDTDGSEILNMPCTIDSLSWSVMKAGHIQYSLTAREYEFVVT